MTTDELLQRWSDGSITADELRELTAKLAQPGHQSALLDDWLLESSLPEVLPSAAVGGLRESEMKQRVKRMDSPRARQWSGWLSWRPLTAAAAGIVFGMFCTSVVYGFVTQRAAVKRTPLLAFDPSFEEMKPLDKGLPHNSKEWGGQSARIVSAENGVSPLRGQRMLRMEPILLNEQDVNCYSNAYQVLDLRSLPLDAVSGAMEVQVTASFCVPESEVKSRYVIRVVALNEPPERATENFWSKAEDAEVVSLSQRFTTMAGDSGWHPFSVKMPLPHSAQTLIIVLTATSPKDKTTQAAVRYLDELQVSLLTVASASAEPHP